MTVADLRERIVAALAARGCRSHTIDEHSNDAHVLPCVAVLAAHASTREDALRALALSVGLDEDGGDPRATMERLRSQSERLRVVRAELATVTRPPAQVDGIEARLLAGASRLRDLLAVDTAGARDVLGLLLDGRLRVRWEGPRRSVWLSGAAVPARALTLGLKASPEGHGHTQRRVPLLRAA